MWNISLHWVPLELEFFLDLRLDVSISCYITLVCLLKVLKKYIDITLTWFFFISSCFMYMGQYAIPKSPSRFPMTPQTIIIFPRSRMSLFHWFNCAMWLPSKSICTAGKFLCTAIWRNHNPIFKKKPVFCYYFTCLPYTSLYRVLMTSCCVCN